MTDQTYTEIVAAKRQSRKYKAILYTIFLPGFDGTEHEIGSFLNGDLAVERLAGQRPGCKLRKRALKNNTLTGQPVHFYKGRLGPLPVEGKLENCTVRNIHTVPGDEDGDFYGEIEWRGFRLEVKALGFITLGNWHVQRFLGDVQAP